MRSSDINLWVIPSFYPTIDHPLRGIFFKEQAEAISNCVKSVTVIYPESRSLLEINYDKIKKFYFQKSINIENGISVYRKHNWNLIRLQFNSFLGQKIWINDVLSLAEDLIKSGNIPDIIHAHCAISAGIAALSLKQKYGIPYILTEHTTGYINQKLSPKLLNLVKNVYKNSNQSIAVSIQFKKLLQNKLDQSDSDILVIPNFIDTDFFSPLKTLKGNKSFTFLTICHLVQKKRVDRLIEAFAFLIQKAPDCNLVIGGTGSEESNLKKLTNNLNLSDKVSFLGELSREEVKSQMQMADCFVLPSDIETFGVVLIEAMSCGIPVIATKSGGPEDIINKNNGILVEKSTDSLIVAMINIKNCYNSFDLNFIRKDVISKYGNKVVSQDYCNIYQKSIVSKIH